LIHNLLLLLLFIVNFVIENSIFFTTEKLKKSTLYSIFDRYYLLKYPGRNRTPVKYKNRLNGAGKIEHFSKVS